MRPVRVLFGALPAALHATLSEAISSQPDIEVVGVASRPMSLLAEVGTRQADTVVVALVDRTPPGITSHLLDQYPHIRVVAVATDGRQALVSVLRPYVEQIEVSSPVDLVRAIRWPDEQPDD
jgi:DNA-binding NarL/FixJ family response regulator